MKQTLLCPCGTYNLGAFSQIHSCVKKKICFGLKGIFLTKFTAHITRWAFKSEQLTLMCDSGCLSLLYSHMWLHWLALKCVSEIPRLSPCSQTNKNRGWGLTSRHRAPALLEMYTFVLLAKFFPTEPKTQAEQLFLISGICQIITLPN